MSVLQNSAGNATNTRETMTDYRQILGYTPSEYQERVFDFVLHGQGNGVIKAVAGSGKTTTIVSAMKLVPKKKKCLFIAFNKSIVEELKGRITDYPNCTVKTIHSLGYQIVKNNLGDDVTLDEYKYRTYLKGNIHTLTGIDPETVRLSEKKVNEYIDTITQLIDFARFNCAQTPAEIRSVADNYRIPLSYDECDIAAQCLKWGRENTDTVDYTDMVWLPYELSLNPKGCKYDWVFADEAQDFSVMATELFFRVLKRGARYIAVGDTNQSINMFAGSSPDAFDTLCEHSNTQIFSLPVTYRCAKSIVRVAQVFSPETIARDGAPEGRVLNNCHVHDIASGDMVLSRSRTPLMKLYVKLLKMERPCYIKGSEIGRDLLDLLDTVDPELDLLHTDMQSDGVFVRLYDRMLNERNRIMEKRGLDFTDATLSMRVMDMYDSINSLMALSSGLNTRQELVDRIERMFDEENNGICLSTVHKAKGLEADRVFILCNSTMPSTLAKKDWEKRQELNIQYVAYTRPKTLLGFVSEQEIPPTHSQMKPDAIVNEVKGIEMNVCRILGKEPVKDIPRTDFARFRIQHSSELDKTVKSTHNGVVGLFKK